MGHCRANRNMFRMPGQYRVLARHGAVLLKAVLPGVLATLCGQEDQVEEAGSVSVNNKQNKYSIVPHTPPGTFRRVWRLAVGTHISSGMAAGTWMQKYKTNTKQIHAVRGHELKMQNSRLILAIVWRLPSALGVRFPSAWAILGLTCLLVGFR